MRCIVWLVLCWSVTSGAIAQQNLFNIPSGAITPTGEFFYQHQINLYEATHLASKQHLVYGLGSGWDAGVNLVGLNLRQKGPDGRFRLYENDDDPARQLKPALLFTGQKQWKLDDHWKLNLGTQMGLNISDDVVQKQYMAFTYLLGVWQTGHTKLVGGPYYGNHNFLGSGNRAGALVGMETPISKRLLAMTDWVIGSNDEAVAVLGINWLVTPRFQICIGGMAGSPGSGNNGGIVLEVNVLTWDEWLADDAEHHAEP